MVRLLNFGFHNWGYTSIYGPLSYPRASKLFHLRGGGIKIQTSKFWGAPLNSFGGVYHPFTPLHWNVLGLIPSFIPNLIYIWAGGASWRGPGVVDTGRGDGVRQGQHRDQVSQPAGDRPGQAEAQGEGVERGAHGLQGPGHLWPLQYYVKTVAALLLQEKHWLCR